MRNKPPPGPTVADLYDLSAPAYAEYWAPALVRHAHELVAGLTDRAARLRTAVDIASGAGTLTPSLRELVGPDGEVVALDRSHGMLRLGPPGIPRVQADAQRLPLAPAVADVAVLAFVLFLLPDARATVAEATRILRPGGWLLAATWGSQLGTGADAVVREELDSAGAPPFPALPRSDELTDTPERMADLLRGAGLVEVETRSRPLDARFDADAAIDLRTRSGTTGWRFAQLEADARASVRRRLTERLGGLAADELADRSEVLLTTARRR